MIYHFSLRNAALVAGAFLVLFGMVGLLRSAGLQNLARGFPRSRVAGIVLLTVAAIWSFWLLATIEMGEFGSFRRPLLVALPIVYFLVIRFVDEFLAVRSLGILCLLAAEPLLDAAFFRYEAVRLVLTVFAYLLVVAGILWVTMPYLLRDQIDWSARSSVRWRCVHGITLLYGAALLVLAITRY